MGLGPLEALLRHCASRGSPSERCVSTACRAGRSAGSLTSGRRCRSRGRLEALRLVAQSWDRAGVVAQIASVVASRGFSNLLSWGHHYRWDPCCFVADLADLCTGEPVCPVFSGVALGEAPQGSPKSLSGVLQEGTFFSRCQVVHLYFSHNVPTVHD